MTDNNYISKAWSFVVLVLCIYFSGLAIVWLGHFLRCFIVWDFGNLWPFTNEGLRMWIIGSIIAIPFYWAIKLCCEVSTWLPPHPPLHPKAIDEIKRMRTQIAESKRS